MTIVEYASYGPDGPDEDDQSLAAAATRIAIQKVNEGFILPPHGTKARNDFVRQCVLEAKQEGSR